jgi:hypothetical protein
MAASQYEITGDSRSKVMQMRYRNALIANVDALDTSERKREAFEEQTADT